MSNKTKGGLTLCVICNKPILDNNDCFSMGSDGYRHKRCKPGSSQWKAKYGESEISKSLSKSGRSNGQGVRATPKTVDPLRQAIKEFCGREKYARYMDTVNSLSIEWQFTAEIAGKIVIANKNNLTLDPEVLYAELTKK